MLSRPLTSSVAVVPRLLSASTSVRRLTNSKLDDFGSLVFNKDAQAVYVEKGALEDIAAATANNEPIPTAATNAFAAGLQAWTRSKGNVTHYTHQFHPLTGDTAEKHDAMMVQSGEDFLSAFSGKLLAKGEPDGSSFPGGDLRATHTARGYTMWDPTSFCYLRSHGTGSTLHVPATFFSYNGESLDVKTPLLRSEAALNREGVRLFKALRMKGHTRMHSEAGIEQEFFLINREYFQARPDLMTSGRTLLGLAPPKGQEFDDQYFATTSPRFLEAINDAEAEMWRLGIPQMTRHREVAPAQYEIAPEFASGNLATDQNQLVMDLLREGAHRHGLEALFHEKPFAHLNGSGKHNNWSVGSNQVGTVFKTGDDIPSNRVFLTFVTAFVRAVDRHPDLLRMAVSGAGNDHRLGGHEAPPAIMSIFLGDDVEEGLQAFLDGASSAAVAAKLIDVGIQARPSVARDATDRNRTSPIANTGNKFELRAVGSSHSPGVSTMVFNTILAESLAYLADEINKHSDKTGRDFDTAVDSVLRETYNKHARVVFNGDNYSAEWREEATRRGLPNYQTTPDALAEMTSAKNMELFTSLNVLSERELRARAAVRYSQYSLTLAMEAKCLVQMYNQHVLPAGAKAATSYAAGLTAVSAAGLDASSPALRNHISQLTAALDSGSDHVAQLKTHLATLDTIEDDGERAVFARDHLLATANALRDHADAVEEASAASDWTLPTYHDMLFQQS